MGRLLILQKIFKVYRKIYLKKRREFHPDKLISKAVPKELLGMANEKLAVINNAYLKIEKAHKMKAGSGEI